MCATASFAHDVAFLVMLLAPIRAAFGSGDSLIRREDESLVAHWMPGFILICMVLTSRALQAVMGKLYVDTPFSTTINSVPIANPSRDWDSLNNPFAQDP